MCHTACSAALHCPAHPPAGVKLSTFDAAKKLLIAGEHAYAEELAKAEALAVPAGKAAAKRACCQH